MRKSLLVLTGAALLVHALPAMAGDEGPAPASPADAAPRPMLAPAPERIEDVGSSAPKPEKKKPKRPDEPTDVFVAGQRATKLAGSVYVVKKDQLERFEYDDPHKVLTAVPGVYVRGEDGFGLRPNIGMRGSNPDRSKKITLMEDGVLFGPAPYSAPAAYYFPMMTRMTGVRVVKGPGAIVYGPQTVGGAIDLVTRPIPTSGAEGYVDMAYGSWGYNKVHASGGWGNERWGFLVEGVHVGSTGFKRVDGTNADTGFSRNEWMVKGRFMPDPDDKAQNTFELKLGYSDEVSKETYLGLTDADFRADPYRRYAASAKDEMRWHRTQLALTHRVRPTKELELVTTAYRNDLARVWNRVQGLSGSTALGEVLADPTSGTNAVWYGILTGKADSPSEQYGYVFGPNDRRFAAMGVQSAVRWSPVTGPITHKAELGLRYHYDDITRYHGRSVILSQDGQFVPADRRPYAEADNTASTHAVSLHVVDAMTWGRVTLTPGLRLESIRSRLDDRLAGTQTSSYTLIPLPGAGAYVELRKDLGLLAGVYRGFSPAPPGDAKQRPEDAVNYEWGARYAGKALRADLLGFYNAYSNITAVCTESSGCMDQNVDKQLSGGAARIFGLEAYVETAPRAGVFSFPIRAAYTLTWSEFLTDFAADDPFWGKVKAGDEMPYVPIHQLNVGAGVETKAIALNVSGTYVGDMRESPGQGEVRPEDLTDAYFLLDASARWRVRRWFQIYLVGSNLLDQKYLVARRPFGARPGAPIALQLGVKAEF
jgi:Fe(3+) dicitrate transport protein